MQIFSVILGLIMLAAFFIMTSNISEIKRILHNNLVATEPRYVVAFNLGELREFQNKKAEALEHYKEALWYINKYNPSEKKLQKLRSEHLTQINSKIQSLTT